MRTIMLVLCAISLAVTCSIALDEFGAGKRPWFGWWDSTFIPAQADVLVIHPRAGGAAMRGGLLDGDRIDLREQSAQARIALLYQLMGAQPTLLMVHRGTSTRALWLTGSSVWDNATFWKLQPMVSRLIANVIFTTCALLLTLRLSAGREARTIAAVLLCAVGIMLDPSFFVVPSPAFAILFFIASRACATAAALLLIRLSASFGAPSRARGALAFTASIAAFGTFAADIAAAAGLLTGRIDPTPFVLSISLWRSNADVLVWLLVTATAAVAVSTTTILQRTPAAGTVLVLPLGFLVSAICFASPAFVHSWVANVAVAGVANAALPLAALITTFVSLTPGSVTQRLNTTTV